MSETAREAAALANCDDPNKRPCEWCIADAERTIDAYESELQRQSRNNDAKAAAWDELLGDIAKDKDDLITSDSVAFVLGAVLTHAHRLLDKHRQRLNATPDPQLDNDYEPENRDELVLIKKGSVPSWMEEVTPFVNMYGEVDLEDIDTNSIEGPTTIPPLFRLSTDETGEEHARRSGGVEPDDCDGSDPLCDNCRLMTGDAPDTQNRD